VEFLGLWDLSSCKKVCTLKGHALRVNAVTMTSAGNFGFSASEDKTVKVWELASSRELHTLKGHSDGVTAIAVLQDSRLLLSASLDKTLKLWEVASGEEFACSEWPQVRRHRSSCHRR